jgi:hypothetical protein
MRGPRGGGGGLVGLVLEVVRAVAREMLDLSYT